MPGSSNATTNPVAVAPIAVNLNNGNDNERVISGIDTRFFNYS